MKILIAIQTWIGIAFDDCVRMTATSLYSDSLMLKNPPDSLFPLRKDYIHKLNLLL